MNGIDKALKVAKTTLIGGYALSLMIPYRVERYGEETTYHAPLYKLYYKKHVGEEGERNVHTYTISTFGLLSDQISTAKRLYTAALFKKPYYKEKASRTFTRAQDKMGCAVAHARSGVAHAQQKFHSAKNKISSLDELLVKFVEDIID